MDESSILVIRAARNRKQLRQSYVDLTSSYSTHPSAQKQELSTKCISESKINNSVIQKV